MEPDSTAFDFVIHRATLCGLVFLLLGCFSENVGGESESSRSAAMASADSTVAVLTDKDSYESGEVIWVTIANDSDSSITTRDQHSFCTIVTLEKESDNQWASAANCTLNTPSREVTLEPNSETVVEMKPHPSQPSQEIAPGRYRATFTYTPGEHFQPTSSETEVVSSPIFKVK